MSKKRIEVDWKKGITADDIKPAVKRFRRYLEDNGLRASTIPMYVVHISKYLEFSQKESPSTEDFARFRDYLLDRKLSRSTIYNYSFSIRKYHEMLGQQVSFNFIKPSNTIPYYFHELDVIKIFNLCYNIKHLAMLKTMFYTSLRASELCNLDDSDVDLKALTIFVHNGKGGKDALVFITDCAKTLRRYLEVRAPLVIDGRKPLFYSDFGGRWERRSVYRMFMTYKKLEELRNMAEFTSLDATVMGSLLVKRGCDIVTIKELIRHSDVHTTMRYLHVSDATKRAKYDQFLQL